MTSPIRARAQIAAKISALGTYVPPRLLTNADLEKMVSTTDEWITTRVGIRERHIVEQKLAEGLAGDELLEMLAASDKGGAKLELDEANALIMAARAGAHWFDEPEPASAEKE